MLSNRELAALIWIAVVLGATLVRPDLRLLLLGVLQALFAKRLRQVGFLALIYTIICTYIFYDLDVWSSPNIKTTILWMVTFAYPAMQRFVQTHTDKGLYLGVLRDATSATVLITFLADIQSYSLAIELIIFPFAVALALLNGVSASNPDQKSVSLLTNWLLGILGGALLFNSLIYVGTNFREVATVSTLRELIVPLLLSMAFLPFLFSLKVFSVYERAWMALDHRIESKSARRTAKIALLRSFGWAHRDLDRWRIIAGAKTLRDEVDVFNSIRQFRWVKIHERNPSPVSSSDGWPIQFAREVLSEQELVCGDYNPFPWNWRAKSDSKKIGGRRSGSYVDYFVEGSARAVTKMTLHLYVQEESSADLADGHFSELIRILLPSVVVSDIPEIELKLGGDCQQLGNVSVRLEYEALSYLSGGYERWLTLTKICHRTWD